MFFLHVTSTWPYFNKSSDDCFFFLSNHAVIQCATAQSAYTLTALKSHMGCCDTARPGADNLPWKTLYVYCLFRIKLISATVIAQLAIFSIRTCHPSRSPISQYTLFHNGFTYLRLILLANSRLLFGLTANKMRIKCSFRLVYWSRSNGFHNLRSWY